MPSLSGLPRFPGADLGDPSADLTDLGADLGSASADLTGAGADLGSASADLTGAGADLGSASADLADLGADLGGAGGGLARSAPACQLGVLPALRANFRVTLDTHPIQS
ncbi:hypothetical protein BAY61_22140 [Prauserella marina]|uniref:Uncharacterized protein n=1 Tax=Prauserella marina TaxID=530584 RepID=A0A222VTL4_9PSEU|nr:hypothetical protein [Prauserella marina]ASR37248.1 hypothetical protein BAY61_22140 [Prauserella marina]PWV72577.1 hypothetical protein DES30_110177 [Prauserella marina]SDD76757.1 hypothetical protein SAMN05421630_11261 [Prauserella marina]